METTVLALNICIMQNNLKPQICFPYFSVVYMVRNKKNHTNNWACTIHELADETLIFLAKF